eukprot:TRINITY_DN25805_c0_g1_i1.p2 TRINITY_DN25805_c0_g1~~TRINITY_DN25805_c0_g1_i1.p2  ORF type:complete len:100 (+),score=20.62 TRINITY_DN25805_c0_g1_i1:62-361(+)
MLRAARAALAAQPKPTPRRSGIQTDVLTLYRRCLRAANRKNDEQSRRDLKVYIRQQFEANRDIPRTSFDIIDYHVYFGRQQLDMLLKTKPEDKFRLMGL